MERERAPRVTIQLIEYLKTKFGTARECPTSVAFDLNEHNARIGENRVIRDLEILLDQQTKGPQ